MKPASPFQPRLVKAGRGFSPRSPYSRPYLGRYLYNESFQWGAQAMRPIGAVLAAALLLGACSNVGLLGVGLEITPDAVNFVPMASETGEGRSHCTAGHVRRFSC